MSYSEKNSWSVKKIVFVSIAGIVGLILICAIFGSFSQVGTGERGIKSRFGEVIQQSYGEGIVFKWPFIESVNTMSVQTQKVTLETSCYTKDVQSAKIKYLINYAPQADMTHKLYQEVGKGYADIVLVPSAETTLSDVIGTWNAQDLVGGREKAKDNILTLIRKAALEKNIIISEFQLLDIKFSDAFEKSIENKVIEEQNALAAINKTRRIDEEAKQTVKTATAEAEAMKIKTQALKENKSLVEYEAVQRWNGVLPHYMGGNAPVPFLNLK